MVDNYTTIDAAAYLHDVFDHVTLAYTELTRFTGSIPGSAIVLRYIKNSYQNDPARVILELFLVFFALKYLFSRRYAPGNNDVELTSKEINELIDEWQPDPLVPEISDVEKTELDKIPVLVSQPGTKIKVAGSSKTVINLTSFNPLGLLGNENIKEKAIAALRKYGVGACGPPGFYGTIDVHMKLEKDIADFFGTEQAILYAQGYSAQSSVIPAFSKRGDLIVCDEGISFGLQKGIQISRSRVVFFKHNDMDDLERVLNRIAEEDVHLKRPLTRKFIIVEGLYATTGDIAPIPKLVELKNRFKYRLLVDESISFGVLGKRGAGVTDYYDIPVTEIDFIVSSMANALCSAGGFCTGANQIVEHQRLSSNAYVFSAALPPMLAVAASWAIYILKSSGPQTLASLRENIAAFRNVLETVPQITLSAEFNSCFPPCPSTVDTLSKRFSRTISAPVVKYQNPLIHIYLSPFVTEKLKSPEEEGQVLQDIVDECLKDGVMVTRARRLNDQELKGSEMRKGLKVVMSAGLTKRETEKAAGVVKSAVLKVLKKM